MFVNESVFNDILKSAYALSVIIKFYEYLIFNRNPKKAPISWGFLKY